MSVDLETEFPNLKNAPITEALIDLQVDLPADTTIQALAKFQSAVGARLVDQTERQSVSAKIEFADGSPRFVAPPFTPDGYVWKVPDEHLVVQARLDGFSLTRLPPYHNGDTFAAQARELWEKYIEVAHPLRVTQLAVRNINRIDLLPGADLERYVLTGPAIARALPQTMSNVLMQVTLPDPSGAAVIITQTFGEVKPGSKTIPFIFDIAAIRSVSLAPHDSQIWELLLELRALKNKFFFNSLTSQALETYR
jgi:uncharacterized protein (TIGR04255 family)